MLFITMSLGVTSTVRELFPRLLPESFSRDLRWSYSSCHGLFWGTHDYFVNFYYALDVSEAGGLQIALLEKADRKLCQFYLSASS